MNINEYILLISMEHFFLTWLERNLMVNEYLFSFIVPVYNTEAFLIKCLDSIIVQQPRNFEIIIVNDGSPGVCDEIVKEFLLKNKNINYVKQKNQGLSSARNAGIDLAKGKYCCFVDSDDYISQKFIATLSKKVIENKHPDMIIIGLDAVSNDKIIDTIKPYKSTIIDNQEGLFKLFQSKEYRSHACTKIIKTYLLKKEPNKELYFPLNLFYEDAATIYKWINKSKEILLVQESLYKYNINNPTSITSQDFTDKHFDLWNNNVKMYYTINLDPKLKYEYFSYIQELFLILNIEMKSLDKGKKSQYIHKMKYDLKQMGIYNFFFNNRKVKNLLFFITAYLFPNFFTNLIKMKGKITSLLNRSKKD
jgi:glycosyltransferase involved in cell wall biosynthesis